MISCTGNDRECHLCPFVESCEIPLSESCPFDCEHETRFEIAGNVRVCALCGDVEIEKPDIEGLVKEITTYLFTGDPHNPDFANESFSDQWRVNLRFIGVFPQRVSAMLYADLWRISGV